jgi:enoyl-CoA hydratase/carnithine racemase
MSDFKFLTFSTPADGVTIVSLNRPPANSVDSEFYRELHEFFRFPDRHAPETKCLVLNGEGKHFCAGNDLDEFATMTPENGRERMWLVREAFFAIMDCPLPVIGAVHGAALGTGMAIAASCDFVVASPEARFGLPELTVGVMGGARHLARIAPTPLVKRMFLTGEPLSARDFAVAGASIVVAENLDPTPEAVRFAKRIASFSPTALRLAKPVLNAIETMDIKSGYAFEQGFTVKMAGHPDSKEALEAFREKRQPEYAPYVHAEFAGFAIEG